MHNRRSFVLACGILFLAPALARGLVISEIHYNPPAGDDALEFVEITNETTTPEDISGYRFLEGILFEFPPHTILSKGASIVLCANASAVAARYGITNTIGDFSGRLDGNGERLTLVNHAGIVVQTLRYRDKQGWPVTPDGTGHTLVLKGLTLDSGEPESWTQSPELGGSPGRPNFGAQQPGFEETVLIDRGATWRFRRGTADFSTPPTAWRGPSFVDTSWESGPSGFGYADGDDATPLDDMINTYSSAACRRRFNLTAADLATGVEFFLGMDYDDGFCAFLNGTEVASSNCNADLLASSLATGSREAGIEDLFLLPRAVLHEGENVLAIVGYNFTLSSSDFSLVPRLIRRRPLGGGGGGPAGTSVVFNELFRGATPGAGWVELYNPDTAAADLTGLILKTDPDSATRYILPPGSLVPARGFLVITEPASGLGLSATEVRFFLQNGAGLVLTATAFDRAPPPGLVVGQYAEARFPDGGALDWVTGTPTRGTPNQVPVVTGVVINEISYHPPEDRDDAEFLELYNRGGAAVDLSGFSFDKGITFTFEAGTSIAAGAYVVVARNPVRLVTNNGYSGALGPYEGQLSNNGENVRLVDDWGNPVDEVRYHEGGRWSLWADGGGSSLELIDPAQDNSSASAWEASDETDKAPWQELRYSTADYIPTGQSELHLFLTGRGICLIDDVSIRRAGGANNIPNPGFETATTPWVIGGTHVRSQRVTYDSHTGGASLEINTSGKGDSIVNRIETDTSPALTRGPYDVSIWARWLRGCSLLVAHGEFNAGPNGGRPGPATNLSGNTLGARLRLSVPLNIGSPGAENSARRLLREATGGTNLGPVIDQVIHAPASPPVGQGARVKARVTDSSGVASVRAFYALGSAGGAFASVDLSDSGLEQDGAAGDGIYGGTIPPQTNGSKVLYYIFATDTLGASRRFPTDAPETTCLYQVQGNVSLTLDTCRIVLDDARTQEFNSRHLHSNDLVDGAFVFNNDEAYYNIGLRYRGSPWGRPGRNSFRVRFPDDQPFHRGETAVNLSSRGGAATEGSGYFLCGRNGTVTKPAPTADHLWVRTFLNGGSYGTQSLIQVVDRVYIEKWYGADAEGPVLKANGRLQFDDPATSWLWDGASYIHMGDVTENYRTYYYHSINQCRDNWAPFIQLSRVMDRRITNNANFNAQIDGIMDVEAYLRVLSIRILVADWDAFSIGNGHNGYLAFDSRTGQWGILPFDMDNSMGDPNFPLFPSSHDLDVTRLMAQPSPRRTYMRILAEFLDGYWNVANAGPFLDALQADVGVGTGGVKSYITSRANVVRSQIASSTTVTFRIVTNGGVDITTQSPTIQLEGDASVRVANIVYRRGDDDLVTLEPTWTTPTRWRAEFDIPEAVNVFQFIGFDGNGGIAGTTSITVRNDTLSGDPRIDAWFPSSGPAAGGFQVTFVGANLAQGPRVFFGNAEAAQVTVESPTTVQTIAPPAPVPLGPGDTVDVEFVFTDGTRVVVPQAVTYIFTGGFLRGDANGDRVIDMSDVMATLFHLYGDLTVSCEDAVDFDDSGALGLNDATQALSFLFRQGMQPPAPYPQLGTDPTADGLTCE